ncbi:probable trafficking protein particle complex subunit 13 homolog [Musca domestica]|uniref:Probable trafficking protein particle complex subunit 13 homolog n=1 Tax=Musca domestica TaxID=7370 RepID=A0A1I8MLW7_MUSDO|nr:probable trafficking protein particle complex subunit 13 homolog [Musca domestica]
MNPLEQGEHLLALKVMRLTRPTLVAPQVISCEPRDLPQFSLKQVLESEASIAGAETLAAGQFMLLPQSFGNIYLGETFSSYICVHNCTSHPVEGVTVKADLQSNNTRINLPMHENKTKPATLGPDETLDDTIRYEVKEIGTHILVCEVNYTTPAGLPQYFRKFFKFQVLKPLDVKTKFYNAEMDEIYLEAQIQNITTGPFCLEKVELDSSDQYTVTSLNTLPNGESVFTSKNMLQPNNSCQFLYCIKPKPEIAKDIKALRAANTVGKLDIVWRSNLGEKGRLQTSQLQRLPFEYKDVRLEVIDAMNIVKIGEPFTFTCRVTNTAERPMDLMVKLPTPLDYNCPYTGSAEFSLGVIDPGQYREFPMTICPSKLGLVKVTPLIFTNTLLQEQYTIEKVVDVFVVDTDYHEDESFQINKFVRYDNAPKIENQSMQLQVV